MNNNPAVWILGSIGLIILIPIAIVIGLIFFAFCYPFMGTTATDNKPA